MAKFMDVHHGMHGITPEALQAAHQADLDIQGEEDVDFQRAWGDPESGWSGACRKPRMPTPCDVSTNERAIRQPRSTRSRSRSDRALRRRDQQRARPRVR